MTNNFDTYRLAIAAPDLLAALEAILPDYVSLIDAAHEMGGDNEWAGQAKARAYTAVLTIAKAKGE